MGKKNKEYSESGYEHNYFPAEDTTTSTFNVKPSLKGFIWNKKMNKRIGKYILIISIVIFTYFFSQKIDIYYYEYIIKSELSIIKYNKEKIIEFEKNIKNSKKNLKCFENQKTRLEQKKEIQIGFCKDIF